MSQNGVSFELQDLTEIVKKSVVVGIRADFRCEFLSVSCGTDRADAKRGDVVQMINLGVEFFLGHLLVYRWVWVYRAISTRLVTTAACCKRMTSSCLVVGIFEC